MKLGAYDYVTKPFKNDELALVVAEGAREARAAPGENESLKIELESRAASHGHGRATARRCSRSSALIEKVAGRAHHRADHRRDGHRQGAGRARHPRQEPARPRRRSSRSTAAPSPRGCVESELFGHVQGAFTGADRRPAGAVRGGRRRHHLPRRGRRAAAARRRSSCCGCSRSGASRRSAGNRDLEVDVRVIAATNRDLGERGEGGPLPRGPLLPAQRHPDLRAAAARAPRGHPAARGALPPAARPRGRARRARRSPQAAQRAAAAPTTGRATCASWRTSMERAVTLDRGDRHRGRRCCPSQVRGVAARPAAGGGGAAARRAWTCRPTSTPSSAGS